MSSHDSEGLAVSDSELVLDNDNLISAPRATPTNKLVET